MPLVRIDHAAGKPAVYRGSFQAEEWALNYRERQYGGIR